MILTCFLLFIPTLFFFFNWFLKDFRSQLSVYLPFSFFLIFLPFFQLFLSWFTGMTIKNYFAYSVLSYLLISLFFAFLIGFFLKKIINKKLSFWNFKINFLYEKNYLILSGLFIISLIILFILENHIFVIPAFQDTYSYAGLTNKFKQNIYGFFTPNDIDMTYKVSQSYYLYSVIYQFPNEGYDFLNRISSYIIIMIIIFLILDKVKIQNFFSALIFIIFSFGAGFLFFFNDWFLSGGNIVIQFLAISLSYALLYSSYKYKHFFSCLSFIAFGFFSITGIALGVVFFLAFIITFIIKLDFKKIIAVSPLIFYDLLINLAVYRNSARIILGTTIIVLILSLVILILSNFIFFNKANYSFFYKLRKINIKLDNLSYKSFLFFNNWKNNFLPKILFFIFFTISLLSSFIYLVLTNRYEKFTFILFFILVIYLIGIFSSIFIFKKTNWTLLFIYLLVDFFSFTFYLFNLFYLHNPSLWRLFNMNSLQFSTTTALIHFLTIFLILYFGYIKEWKTVTSFFFKMKIRFSFSFKVSKKQKNYRVIKNFFLYKNFLSIKIFSLAAVFLVFVPPIALIERFKANFTDSFYQKYFVTTEPQYYFKKEDVSWLNSLNSTINLYDYIFSDAPIWNVLSKGIGVTKSTNNIFWEYGRDGTIDSAKKFLKNYVIKTLVNFKPKYIIIWKNEFYTSWLLSIMGNVGNKLTINEKTTFDSLSLTPGKAASLTYINLPNSSSNFLFYEIINSI